MARRPGAARGHAQVTAQAAFLIYLFFDETEPLVHRSRIDIM